MTQTLKPYKIVTYEPGASTVFDRETGRECGYVLQDFHGNWEPMRNGTAVGELWRYREDAARAVWESR